MRAASVADVGRRKGGLGRKSVPMEPVGLLSLGCNVAGRKALQAELTAGANR